MKKFLVIALLFSSASFAQDTEYPEWVQKALAFSRSEILRHYGLTTKKAAYWVPSLQVSQRFNGYYLYSLRQHIPVAITTFDLQFFRYSPGFAGVKAYVQTSLSQNNVLNGTYAGVGGFGGGYVFDNRKLSEDKKIISGTALAFIGEGYKMWNTEDSRMTIGGGGFEFRVTHNFHQFFALTAGLNLNFGGISMAGIQDNLSFVSYGASIGLAF